MNKKLILNMVSSCTDHNLTQVETTWDEVLDLIKQPHGTGKLTLDEYLSADKKTRHREKDSAGLIPCSVKDELGKRVQENMDIAYLAVLDIDSGLPIETIRSVLDKYEYAVHSSYSHSPEIPKWRVFLPLNEPIPASELPVLFNCMHGLFDEKLDTSCGNDPSRLYYLPATPADAEKLFVFEHHEGEWLEASALISSTVLATAAAESAATGTAAIPTKTASPKKVSTKAAKKIYFDIGFPDGQRTLELTKRIGHCLAHDASIEETTDRCLKWNTLNTPPLDESKVISTVESIAKSHERKRVAMAEDGERVIEKMNKEYAYIRRLGYVYRLKFRDLINAEKLRLELANTHVWAPSKGKMKDLTHAEAWLASPARLTFDDMVFSPGEPLITGGSINLWHGWGVDPKAGDITPWTKLLNHIFNGDADMQHWFERWAAYPIQYPGTKMNTAVVFWSSVQGVGKTLIGQTLGKIYGEHNFKTISAVELHGSFNSWMKECQLVLGEENSSADRRADSNKLKHYITGENVIVNEKYVPAIEMINRINFIFTSNHPDAFHIAPDDRRFFVWGITAPKMSDEFYADFVKWRDTGGSSALMHYFQNLDLSDFIHKASAPMTESKNEMIDISRTDAERWINETFDDEDSIRLVLGKEVTTIDEVCRAYNREHPHSYCNTTAMSRAMRRKFPYVQRRIATHRGRKSLITLYKHEEWQMKDSREWVDEFKKPTPTGLEL